MKTNNYIEMQSSSTDITNIADNVVNSRDQALTVLVFIVLALIGAIYSLWRKQNKDADKLQNILLDQVKTNSQAVSTLESIVKQHSELTDEIRDLKVLFEKNSIHVKTTLEILNNRKN